MGRSTQSEIGQGRGVVVLLAYFALAFFLLTGCSGANQGSASGPGAGGTIEREAGGDNGSEKTERYGRWHAVHPRGEAAEGRVDEVMARLEAIGYASGSREAGGTGVTVYDPARAGSGYNLYVSGHGPEAILMDMDGRVLHCWRYPHDDVWPDDDGPHVARKDGPPSRKGKEMTDTSPDVDFFRNARLFPNGDLLAIFEGRGLIKVDKDSNLIWAARCGAHHDLDILDNGDILVLTREATINPLISSEKPILEDFITTLDSGGRQKQRISLVDCFAAAPQFEAIWRSSENKTGDLFHTNTLFVLRDVAAGAPAAFKAGRVLTSMRMLNAVAVVDLEAERVVWARTGRFRAQHDPRLLANGNLLLFDNLGVPNRSRVLEFDLEKWRPAWSYIGSAEHPFFSETCGTSQRLDNGNTLITESDGGRAFEVTPGGEIVWEFWNPHRAGDRDQFIASLFTVRRLSSAFPVHWAGGGSP